MTKVNTLLPLRLLLCIAMCLLLGLTALAVPVRAADVDIMFNDPGVMVGNGVTVNVYTTGEVAGVNLTIVYDTDYLTYTGSSGGLGNASVQDNGGTITIVDYHSTAAAKFSLNLNFTAKAIGSTTLRPTACTVSDASGDLMGVEFASHSSVVSITSASSDCNLSALYIDPGMLSPAFSAGQTNYTVTVPNSATWLAVSPVKSDASATYSIAGNDWLNVGLNYVTVTVTAGNGAQKTYTMAVTRQAAEVQATPVPDNTVDTTPEETPVYVIAPDGSQLVVGTFTAEQIPDGFRFVELSWEGENVQAIRSVDESRTALWCQGNAAYGAGFYAVDMATGGATPLNVLSVPGGSWVVLHPQLSSSMPPADCDLGSVTVEGVSYEAYVPRGGGEYAILYAVSPEGVNGFYQYDTREKTLQRYGLSGGAVLEAAEEWLILDPDFAGVATPEGYTLMDIVVDGKPCRGYVPADAESTSHYVVCARRGDTTGLYIYDIHEGTYQRYGLVLPEAAAAEEMTETEEALAAAERQLRINRWIFLGGGVVLLASLVSVVILAVLFNKRDKR